MNELFRRHRPVLRVHPAEKYYPVSPDWYLKNTTALEPQEPTGPLNACCPQGRSFPAGKKFDFRNPQPTQALFFQKSNEDGSVDLAYIFFFAYNGAKRILGVFPTGSHAADFEKFLVHILPSGELGFYALSTHGSLQLYNVHSSIRARGGVFDTSETIEFEDGQPLIYSAVNAHALYPRPGSYVRFFGLGNDNTAHGPRVDFFYTRAEDSESWHYPHEWGMKYNSKRSRMEPSVMALQTSLYSQGLPPNDREPKLPLDLYRMVIPHHTDLGRFSFLMSMAYLGFLVIPAIYLVATRKRKGKTRWALALLIFTSQFYLLKLALFLLGPRFGVEMDRENIWGWIFPFSFY